MTTTIGIKVNDGIILGADTRATMGHFIASKEAKKLHQLDTHTGITLAGSVGDALKLISWISIEASLYKFRRGESMTVKGITRLLSNILNGSRVYPYSVAFIIGGVDKNGATLYSSDGVGGVIEETMYASTGSGSVIAYGVLEDRYEPMDTSDGIELAVRALHTAMQRDSASGNGIKIVVIDADGYREISDEIIARVRENL